MFKFIISFFIFLHFILFAAGQDRVQQFVKQTAVPIPTIEPDSTNFSDLEAIGTAIGDATIVMLGEQDHGDAPVFLAKTRLIKYLHEKKGFNVLAFESDFFGLNEGWEHLTKEKPAMDSFFRKNIFPIWTYCNTCSNLFFDYLPGTYKTAHPVMVTGFDNQMILGYSSRNLVSKLDSVLRQLDLPVVKEPGYSTVIIPAIDSLRHYYSKLLNNPDFYGCGKYLAKIKQQAAEKNLGENDFWMQVIDNLIAENTEYQLLKTDKQQSGNTRDLQMAQNLQWLATVKYPTEKIIVWAANAHIAKYADSLKDDPGKAITAMGSFFTRNNVLLKKTYILGFTSYEGEAGRLGFKNFTIRKPKSDGFESWIDKSWNYAFVDFRNFT
ncbi:MAG TPA: erythromycin esterase family protein, partial [Chitinophagaceae bacterium]|nr:erythromycin esterase family protein [Chitinophagaceae bacterium]